MDVATPGRMREYVKRHFGTLAQRANTSPGYLPALALHVVAVVVSRAPRRLLLLVARPICVGASRRLVQPAPQTAEKNLELAQRISMVEGTSLRPLKGRFRTLAHPRVSALEPRVGR
jgi:hypothetical protein